MTVSPELVLRWSDGSLNLMGWNSSDQGEFKVETLADGTDWGNPAPVRRALRRFLLDGSASAKEYDDNRQVPLKLCVSAPDGTALAAGEAALATVDGRRCELVWTPPMGVPAVFIVVSADVKHVMDDEAENAGERYYSLTLECLPHTYSDEWIVVPALPQAVSTPTLIDNCSSTTGWSAVNVTLETTSRPGSITVENPPAYQPDPWSPATPYAYSVTRTGTIDFSTETYLSVDFYSGTGELLFEVQTGSGWVTVPEAGTDGGRTVYDIGSIATSISAFRYSHTYPYPWATAGLVIFHDVYRQATQRSTASRQQIRAIAVPGSQRTPASVIIDSPTTGLGTTVMYAGPNYDPTLSQYTVTAGRSGNAARLSGGQHVIPEGGTGIQFTRPASTIPPGEYAVWGMLDVTETGLDPNPVTFTVTTSVQVGTAAPVQVGSVALPETPSLEYLMFPLGSVTLPGAALPVGSTQPVTITLSRPTAPSDGSVTIDEVFLFNLTDGGPMIVESGTATTVWIDPPTLDVDTPSVLIGSGNKVDAMPASLSTELVEWSGSPSMVAPATYLYVGTEGSPETTVTARFRAAHHTYPTS